jgi:hypothetical protein
MFCPQCGEEFSWHVMVCPTCDVDTVATSFSYAMGPAQFMVRADDAGRVRELLKDLTG